MGFEELELQNEYRSRRDKVSSQFYYPILKRAVTYDRAVGFFSSTALICIADGLLPFVNNGGSIRLIASPKLSEEDVEAIKNGYASREEVIKDAAKRELYEPENFIEENRLALLTKLIEDGRLKIKLATVGQYGLYHEKIGVFADGEGNHIAFTGSMNETYAAMTINYESFDVFCSWKNENDAERVEEKIVAFDTLWNDQDDEVNVQQFLDIEDEIIQKYRKKYEYEDFDERDFTKSDQEEESVLVRPNVPTLPEFDLYDYQKEAIASWREHEYRGIFDMATGTGKTYTGIGALCELFKNKKRIVAIIVCPLTHLVEQWVDDLHEFNINPIVAYGVPKYKDYPAKIKKAIFEYNLGIKDFICIICTKDTFVSAKLQNEIERIPGEICLMVDEAHNMGARSYLAKLSDKYVHRLALSATFERHGDAEGTEHLYEYFGEKCIEYPIERAINEKKLTPYNYYPIIVYLNDEELAQYNELSVEIRNNLMVDEKGKTVLNEKAKRLAIKRARIVAGADSKTEALKKEIEPFIHDNHMLVYCGATSEYTEDNEVLRQIDKITRMLGHELGMKVAQFTAQEDGKKRALLKQEFLEGTTLQALVAIKCLDEGVNIPAIDRAFILASTTNPKEYIQRRGRVLRKAPGKEKAYIYDFVTLPYDLQLVPFLSSEELENSMSLVRNELRRVEEFQRIADNYADSIEVVNTIKEAYEFFEQEDVDEQFEETIR